MITQEQQKQGTELMNTLVQKAWDSAEFKEQLIQNPVSTIKSFSGKEIQAGFKVVVEDQTDESTIYLNIPSQPELDELELTEDQLSSVAGGVSPTIVIAFYCVTAMGAGVAVGKAL